MAKVPSLRNVTKGAIQSVINFLSKQIEAALLGILGENIYYVGKHGSDSNTGRSLEQAFLTFGKAIQTAISKSPSETNRIAIWCEDAALYTENLAVPSWVGILAFAARIDGQHTLAENSLLHSYRLIFDGTGSCVSKTSGAGGASVVCGRMLLGNSANGVFCTSGSLDYQGDAIQVTNGFGIGSTSTGTIDARVNAITVSGTGIAVGIASSGDIDLQCNRITGGAGSIGLYAASTGNLRAQLSDLNCDTAYNVTALASLSLFVNELSGTRSSAGTANVTIAGFAKQQVTLVANSEATNLGAAVRFGAGIFNADGYPAGSTFTLRAACEVDGGQPYNVRLYDVTAGAYVGGTIADTNGSLEVKTLALTLGAGERIYELRAWLTTGAGGADYVRVPSAFIDVVP